MAVLQIEYSIYYGISITVAISVRALNFFLGMGGLYTSNIYIRLSTILQYTIYHYMNTIRYYGITI